MYRAVRNTVMSIWSLVVAEKIKLMVRVSLSGVLSRSRLVSRVLRVLLRLKRVLSIMLRILDLLGLLNWIRMSLGMH